MRGAAAGAQVHSRGATAGRGGSRPQGPGAKTHQAGPRDQQQAPRSWGQDTPGRPQGPAAGPKILAPSSAWPARGTSSRPQGPGAKTHQAGPRDQQQAPRSWGQAVPGRPQGPAAGPTPTSCMALSMMPACICAMLPPLSMTASRARSLHSGRLASSQLQPTGACPRGGVSGFRAPNRWALQGRRADCICAGQSSTEHCWAGLHAVVPTPCAPTHPSRIPGAAMVLLKLDSDTTRLPAQSAACGGGCPAAAGAGAGAAAAGKPAAAAARASCSSSGSMAASTCRMGGGGGAAVGKLRSWYTSSARMWKLCRCASLSRRWRRSTGSVVPLWRSTRGGGQQATG